MKTAATILLALAVLGILADAYETRRKLRLPGFREAGIPWRWLPRGLVVPGRLVAAGAVLALGLYGIAQGVTWVAVGALAVVAALSWGAAVWNRRLV